MYATDESIFILSEVKVASGFGTAVKRDQLGAVSHFNNDFGQAFFSSLSSPLPRSF